MKSIFIDKQQIPNQQLLKMALGDTFECWQLLYERVKQCCPESTDQWKFSSEKLGWSFRVSDHKRVLLYFLPRDGFYKVAFVFGHKAFEKVLVSSVSNAIKEQLRAAKPFAEGRGIRIEVRNTAILNDIFTLLAIKLSN